MRSGRRGIDPSNGVAFTGEGKQVRKATGCEQQRVKAALSRIGSRAARAELPAAIGAYRCPTDFSDEAHLQWNIFGMKEVERPAPILVAALNHGFDSVTDAAVGFDSCIPQIIESAQDVVVPKRRQREAEPAFVDDFAGSKRAEHAALEQIVFGPPAGVSDGRRFA